MKNNTFSQLYQEKVSLQSVQELFIEYVYQRYCAALHLHSNAVIMAIEKTSVRLQVDQKQVVQILIKLGYESNLWAQLHNLEKK